MKMIKIELKKAFTGSRFWLAFCIGQFLGISSILTVYRSWLSQRDYIQYWENRFPVRQAYTLYNVWILNEQLSIGRTLFFFWLPFLAAFPFAASYYQEEKKKQLRLVLVRTGRREYFRAKYLAVFLSGFVVISGTLLVNLAISAAFFPWEKPLPFYPYFSILENDFGAAIFLQLSITLCRNVYSDRGNFWRLTCKLCVCLYHVCEESVSFFWNRLAGLCGSRSNQKYPVCRKFKSAGNIGLWFLKRLRLCEKRMDHTWRRAFFPAHSADTCRKTGKYI